MKKIIVTITFTGAVGGNVTTIILGPNTKINYQAKAGDPPRSFDLEPANYSIVLNGVSGGTCNLSVDDQFGNNLIKDSCPPNHIFIAQVFTV